MNFFKSIFKSKDSPVRSYEDFWAWFSNNEKDFFTAVKNHSGIEKKFFDKISPKLAELKDGYFYLTGMYDDHTAELILTADANPANIVFVEELVAAAPVLPGWRFTALKPSMDISKLSIEMAGIEFNKETLEFYANDIPGYPDEIDIVFVHKDFSEENKKTIINGIYIFLDNYLGEMDALNNIDTFEVRGKEQATQDLIPIEKLKDYLTWRQKEFVEKYEGVRYNTNDDTHSVLEATLKNGNALFAVINTEVLEWDSKASHPWVAEIRLSFIGRDLNGMPNEDDYKLLETVEETLLGDLRDEEGCLNIGRQTASGERAIYFACKDFRKVSRAFFNIRQKYAGKFSIGYDIYKDKYWQSFERFMPSADTSSDDL